MIRMEASGAWAEPTCDAHHDALNEKIAIRKEGKHGGLERVGRACL